VHMKSIRNFRGAGFAAMIAAEGTGDIEWLSGHRLRGCSFIDELGWDIASDDFELSAR